MKENLLLIFKNWKQYIYWKSKKNGKKFNDLNRGPGYYFQVESLGYTPIGAKWKTKLENGKIGIFELIDYETFEDPCDMIKDSYFNFIGYEGVKQIHECSFKEYLLLYC